MSWWRWINGTLFDNLSLPFIWQDPSIKGLVCHAAVRRVRGQRLVCTGVWQDSDVFVKFYFHRWRRRRHWRREDRGVRALLANNIVTPSLVFSGPLADSNAYAIVTERIAPAQTVLDAWQSAHDDHARSSLLHSLVAAVAQHHAHGLVQTDMHLKNFLVCGERLYSLDGAGFKIQNRPVSRATGLNNLGLLCAQFEPVTEVLIEGAFPAYCAVRGGDSERDLADLKREIAKNRAYRTRKYLEKVFRDCTAFASGKDFRHYYVYDREYDSPDLRHFVADPEGYIEQNADKSRNADGTWQIAAAEHLLIVRRYDQPSAAARVWKETHRRRMDKLPAPRPVALVERRFGPFPRYAYLAMGEKTDES